jgi:hypothetical protein
MKVYDEEQKVLLALAGLMDNYEGVIELIVESEK